MTTAERRAAILQQLAHAGAPIAARTLATHYGVSRQVIVQDLAVIREIRFHNNKCILICNCAVFQIFQHLSFQFIIIWGIHKNNIKNTFSLKGTQCLQHVHVQQFTIFCQFCKCKIFSDACSSFWILLHKHCIRSPSAQSFDSDPATSGKKIQETAFQKLRLKYIK